jgi:hypothetical protein
MAYKFGAGEDQRHPTIKEKAVATTS